MVAFEVDPRSVSKESLRPAPVEGDDKQKEGFETGDKCVYPSDVSVMELKHKSESTNISHSARPWCTET